MSRNARRLVVSICQLLYLGLMGVAVVSGLLGPFELGGTSVLTASLVGVAASASASMLLVDVFDGRLRDLSYAVGSACLALWSGYGYGTGLAVFGGAAILLGFGIAADWSQIDLEELSVLGTTRNLLWVATIAALLGGPFPVAGTRLLVLVLAGLSVLEIIVVAVTDERKMALATAFESLMYAAAAWGVWAERLEIGLTVSAVCFIVALAIRQYDPGDTGGSDGVDSQVGEALPDGDGLD